MVYRLPFQYGAHRSLTTKWNLLRWIYLGMRKQRLTEATFNWNLSMIHMLYCETQSHSRNTVNMGRSVMTAGRWSDGRDNVRHDILPKTLFHVRRTLPFRTVPSLSEASLPLCPFRNLMWLDEKHSIRISFSKMFLLRCSHRGQVTVGSWELSQLRVWERSQLLVP